MQYRKEVLPCHKLKEIHLMQDFKTMHTYQWVFGEYVPNAIRQYCWEWMTTTKQKKRVNFTAICAAKTVKIPILGRIEKAGKSVMLEPAIFMY